MCDALTEGVLYFTVIFSPWAFGTTKDWSTWVMNVAGYALGLLLVAKWLIRWRTGGRVARWTESRDSDSATAGSRAARLGRACTATLAVLTATILAYCLVGALNARATYHHEFRRFDYFPCLDWLPHSYDRASTWFSFWSYLALAAGFWAARDWLLGRTAGDNQPVPEAPGSPRPAARLTRLLWVLSLNGTALGLEGILQRLEGSGRLLWLVTPRFNFTADAQFGPYAYRSNAAQYFNLLWPVCLGFWWWLRRVARRGDPARARAGGSAHVVLLPCAVLLAACPIISLSRAGALVAVLELGAAFAILLLASRTAGWRTRVGLFGVFALVLGLGGFLGWEKLQTRLQKESVSGLGPRAEIYQNARAMAADYPLWGLGPGTFASLYQMYRTEPEFWAAQAHDDWIETRVTFGWAGFALIFAALVVLLSRWAVGDGLAVSGVFAGLLGVAFAGCLAHAKFDFPFQVYSVLHLFLLLGAIAFAMTRKP